MVSDNLSGPTRTSRPSRRALIAGAGVAGAGLAAAASVATAGPAAARGPALTTPRPAAGPAALRMASAGDGGLRRASVRLGLTGRGRRSATVAGDPFSSVALTWRSGSPALSLRVRGLDGVWQPWQAIGHLHDGPTVGTAEWRAARRTSATGLTWVGDADAIEVAADGPVADLRVEMLDAAAAELPEPAGGVSARTAPMSRVYTRASWGADESLRTGSPTYLDHLQQVHVHHTAGANSYAVDDVPRLLRSMLAYHTQTLGWSDIGYNLLVDRFGRAFEGRAGGAKRLVRGAHTLGFNHTSCGIALMGNYETARPPGAAVQQLEALAAYKFDVLGQKALRKLRVASEGSDKYPKGTVAYLWAMDAHRDTNDTACPGRYLYAAMDDIRKRTQARIDAY